MQLLVLSCSCRMVCPVCKDLYYFTCRLCHYIFIVQKDLMILEFKRRVGNSAKASGRCGLQSLWITNTLFLKRNWSSPFVVSSTWDPVTWGSERYNHTSKLGSWRRSWAGDPACYRNAQGGDATVLFLFGHLLKYHNPRMSFYFRWLRKQIKHIFFPLVLSNNRLCPSYVISTFN